MPLPVFFVHLLTLPDLVGVLQCPIAVRTRMNGTKNIAKITKSMKMVSAAKLRGDQQRLAAADPFAVRFCVCVVCTFGVCVCVCICDLIA